MRPPLGLTREASDLLDVLQEFRFAALDDLHANRDANEVDRLVAELKRAGLVRVEVKGRRRPVVHLTEAGVAR